MRVYQSRLAHRPATERSALARSRCPSLSTRVSRNYELAYPPPRGHCSRPCLGKQGRVRIADMSVEGSFQRPARGKRALYGNTVNVYSALSPGADASFLLYEDDGISFDYRKGEWMGIQLAWDDAHDTLRLQPAPGSRMLPPGPRPLRRNWLKPHAGSGLMASRSQSRSKLLTGRTPSSLKSCRVGGRTGTGANPCAQEIDDQPDQARSERAGAGHEVAHDEGTNKST